MQPRAGGALVLSDVAAVIAPSPHPPIHTWLCRINPPSAQAQATIGVRLPAERGQHPQPSPQAPSWVQPGCA